MTLNLAPCAAAIFFAAAASSAGPISSAGVLMRSRARKIPSANRSTSARSAPCGQTSLAQPLFPRLVAGECVARRAPSPGRAASLPSARRAVERIGAARAALSGRSASAQSGSPGFQPTRHAPSPPSLVRDQQRSRPARPRIRLPRPSADARGAKPLRGSRPGPGGGHRRHRNGIAPRLLINGNNRVLPQIGNCADSPH